MSVTFSGLASGIDTASIIESLIEIESAPITTMENTQTYLETQAGHLHRVQYPAR